MNHKRSELDVDFIGGGRPLTKEDEIAISKFIHENKAKRVHKRHAKRRAKVFAEKQHAA